VNKAGHTCVFIVDRLVRHNQSIESPRTANAMNYCPRFEERALRALTVRFYSVSNQCEVLICTLCRNSSFNLWLHRIQMSGRSIENSVALMLRAYKNYMFGKSIEIITREVDYCERRPRLDLYCLIRYVLSCIVVYSIWCVCTEYAMAALQNVNSGSIH
jgi:hypothetical protein